MSTTEVDAEELDSYFKETQRAALLCLERSEFEEALQLLSINERVLEEAKSQGFPGDFPFVLSTLHNLSCCHQSLNRVEESASYLEACLYNLQTTYRPSETSRRTNEKYKLKKYECRARIQLCALLSQLGRHEAALSHAQAGLHLSQSLLCDVLLLCKDHLSHHRKLLPGAQSKPYSDSARKLDSPIYKQRHTLVTSAYPILELIDLRLRTKQKVTQHTSPRLEIRSPLGVQHYNDWIYTFSMSDLMRIQPLTLFELSTPLESFSELTRDMLLDKVCLLVAGFFCVATEVRLLYGGEDSDRLREAQHLHMKAVLIAKDILPLEAPLLEHIQVSFQKYYSQLVRVSRRGQLDTSQRLKSPSPLLSTQPRSSSAKSMRRKPQPQKPKSPAPTTRCGRRQPPLTERTSSRKVIIEPKPEESGSSDDDFILCSEDLYGDNDHNKRFVECSVDIRDWDEGKATEYSRLLSSTGGH